jgi:hypothetical protein
VPDAGEIILARLEYLLSRTAENESEAAWIQFCEGVVLASLFHESGLLGDEAFRSVQALEERVGREMGSRKKRGSCRMIA